MRHARGVEHLAAFWQDSIDRNHPKSGARKRCDGQQLLGVNPTASTCFLMPRVDGKRESFESGQIQGKILI